MKALRWYGRKDLRYEDIPEPSPGPGQLKVKISLAGICGTDLKEYAAAGLGGKPAAERKIEVTIFDVYDNIATVKIDSADFLDYAHMAKINGEWKIINVLWALHPKAPTGGDGQ